MINRSRLFFASCIALITTAMSFAIRGDIMDPVGIQFHLSKQDIGLIAGPAFYGFTLAMMFGGPLCDVLGMGTLLALAFVLHAAGIITTIFAHGFWSLYIGTLLIGIGNGSVEAACNPLIATMFPDQKIKKLSAFHAWFPGGIAIGGLLCFGFSNIGFNWQIKMATMLLPLLAYGFLFFGQSFPRTERVASGISTGSMFAACVRPFFLLMVFCMLLTSSTELATNQWISSLLNPLLGSAIGAGAGILILVWINGLMSAGRQLAGPVVHRLSPLWMLTISAALSTLGLLAMSAAHSAWLAFAAATLFSVGVCYFWPTMLGVTSERVPKSGALGLAIMGGAGMFSVSVVLPIMGRFVDVNDASGKAAQLLLRNMAILPAILFVIFLAMALVGGGRKGYHAERLSTADEEHALEQPMNA
jgi:MFS family permease